jgi:uncharacterized delta-60 repeat protein
MFGMVTAAVALFCAAVAVVPSAARLAAPDAFADGGRVAAIGHLGWPSGREDTAVAGDGDIYVAATPRRNDRPRSVEVRRYLPDGRLDPSFGDDGSAVLDQLAGLGFRLGELLVDSNGLPYLVGTIQPDRPTVARLTAEGALDSTYGDAGLASFDFGQGAPFPYAAIDQANRVLLTAGRLVRLDPGGTLDATFGDGGTVPIPGQLVDGIGVDEKGRVQLALPDVAGNERAFRLMRLDDDGGPDRSLGPTGLRTYSRIGAARAIAVGADGSTLVLGTATKRDRDGTTAPLLSIGSRGIHAPSGRGGRRLAVHLHGRSYASRILSDPNGDDYLIGTQVTRRPGRDSWRDPRRQALVIDLDGSTVGRGGGLEHQSGLYDFFGRHRRVIITSPAETIAAGASITDGGRRILVDGIARDRSGENAAHAFLTEIPTAERVITYAPEPVGGG